MRSTVPERSTLGRQADDVRIIEQVEQKVFNIVQGLRAPKVEQQDANFI